MKTNTLLINRAMGAAMAEDYIAWAADALGEGMDSPSLRILAGLNPRFDRDAVELYFQKTREETRVEALDCPAEPRKIAGLFKKAYDQGEMSAETASRAMADLFRKSHYSDPLFAIWYDIEEALDSLGSGDEGYFYPPAALNSLESVFEREWSLFERASRLDLPPMFPRFILCDRCGYVGEPKPRRRLSFKIWTMAFWFSRRQTLWNACARCGSFDHRSVSDPDVRDTYFARLERARAALSDNVGQG